ncbi:MAG TPA: glycosyltransferase family 9 protein [Planktothrix sp.]|jgi:heptosyltransferase-2
MKAQLPGNRNGNLLPARRILVIRYRFLGDTILSAPFLRNLRLAYPDAKIDMLVGPQSGDVLKGCPYVDELITFDTTRFHKYDSGEGEKKSFWSYVRLLRQRKYDLAFVLKRSWSSAALALFAGAKYRVGYATEGRQIILTHSVPFNTKIHEVQSTLDVLRVAHVPIVDDRLEAWISAEEQSEIEARVEQLKSPNRKVVIHAAAAHPDKMCSLSIWAAVMQKLKGEEPTTFFFTGAEQDIPLYRELEGLAGFACVNLAGQLSIRQSMALYKNMALSACVDSGPAHLSAAVGTPTVAVFGPTDPERWRPYGPHAMAVFDQSLECRPCFYKKTCDDRPCLTKLDAEQIVSACHQVLKAAAVAR